MNWNTVLPVILPVAVLGGLGLLFGLLLGFASKKFSVKEDETAGKIREALPGANCGGCGFVGCDEYAKAVAEGTAKPNLCAVGGKTSTEAIARILGVAAEEKEPMMAFVRCSGSCDKAPDRVEYYGAADCAHAALLPGGGQKACTVGCLGLGTCAAVCKFGAMSVENGVAHVDPSKCTGCGTCASVCPRGLIEMIPASAIVGVACSSKAPAKEQNAVCKAGCIACGICVKNCPQLTIRIEDNLAAIDRELCIGCGICAEKCPRHVIEKFI